jgi:hypothetical protein
MLCPQGRPLEILVSMEGASPPVLRVKGQPGVQSLPRAAFVNGYVRGVLNPSSVCQGEYLSFAHSLVFSVREDRGDLCVISELKHVSVTCASAKLHLFHLHFLQRTRISLSH